MKSSIQQDIIIVNICLSNDRPSKYMKQNLTELKEAIDGSTIAGISVSSFTISDRKNRQRISKETEDLNNRINQLGLTSIHRILYPARGYIFFSSAHGVFSRMNHISDHR